MLPFVWVTSNSCAYFVECKILGGSAFPGSAIISYTVWWSTTSTHAVLKLNLQVFFFGLAGLTNWVENLSKSNLKDPVSVFIVIAFSVAAQILVILDSKHFGIETEWISSPSIESKFTQWWSFSVVMNTSFSVTAKSPCISETSSFLCELTSNPKAFNEGYKNCNAAISPSLNFVPGSVNSYISPLKFSSILFIMSVSKG